MLLNRAYARWLQAPFNLKIDILPYAFIKILLVAHDDRSHGLQVQYADIV